MPAQVPFRGRGLRVKAAGSRRFAVETALPPLCARIRSRPPSHPFRARAAPLSLANADAIRRGGAGRQPSIAGHSRFGCGNAVSLPASRRRLRQRPTRRARFRFHESMTVMPRDAWRTLKRRADRPRLFRRSPSAIWAARRERLRPGQTSPQAHASRPGLDKNLLGCSRFRLWGTRHAKNPRSCFLIGAAPEPFAKPRKEPALLGARPFVAQQGAEAALTMLRRGWAGECRARRLARLGIGFDGSARLFWPQPKIALDDRRRVL